MDYDDQEIIGDLLVWPDLMTEAVEYLAPEDFIDPRHKIIFAHAVSLYRQNGTYDVPTIRGCQGVDPAFVMDAIEACGSRVNFSVTLRRIQERSAKERIKKALQTAADDAAGPQETASTLISRTERKLRDESERLLATDPVPGMDTHITTFLRTLDTGRDIAPRVFCGIDDLDKHAGGIPCTGLTIVGARTSMGKSAFASSIAPRLIGGRGGLPGFFFSMEMAADEVVGRMIAARSRITLDTLMPPDGSKPELSDEEFGRLSEATASLSNLPLMIDDAPKQTTDHMRAVVKRTLMRLEAERPSVIFVDYLQLIDTKNHATKNSNREQDVSRVTEDLRVLARENSCPVIALAQLNRGAENRSESRPRLSDLRESGSIEQEAHMVLGLYRPAYYDEEAHDADDEILVLKNRGGTTGKVYCRFYGEFSSWENRGGY